MAKTNFYVASIVKGGKSGLVPPDERQDARRWMTGVAIYAQTGSRTADPTFLVPDVGVTGNVPIASPDKREYYDLMVGSKTEHKDGQQYITPHDLAVAVYSMSQDSKHGGQDRLPVLDRTTGRVTFDLHAGSNVASNLRQVTRTFYDLDTPKPLPTGKPEEVAKAMPGWQANDDQRQADRNRHAAKFSRYALCSADMAGMQESDIDRISSLVKGLTAQSTTAPAASNATDPWQGHGAGGGNVSAFGGGVDPAAQATKSSFADAVGPKAQLLLGYNPHTQAALAKIAAQTPTGDQIVGAPWHRRDERRTENVRQNTAPRYPMGQHPYDLWGIEY